MLLSNNGERFLFKLSVFLNVSLGKKVKTFFPSFKRRKLPFFLVPIEPLLLFYTILSISIYYTTA